MSFQSYKDLEVYKLAHKLAVELHTITLSLPKFELYEEGSQIRRSSKSISTNIVEGFGRRRYKAEFIKYLVYAHASCDETIEHLELLYETKSLKDKNTFDEFVAEYDKLGRMLNKFIQSVEQTHLVKRDE
ncbi:MAG: four helix bundle protein [Planctomycetota bacterium]|nr:four helix bundle protein [Planctomycetota bacterium]MDI6788039.1 four helix bundle protein [Planctomycetota bacterium]